MILDHYKFLHIIYNLLSSMPTTSYIRRTSHYAECVQAGFLIGTHDQPLLLNKTGHRIWEGLEYATSLDQLVDCVVREFAIARDIARPEIEAFIVTLCDLGLVRSADAPDLMRDRYLGLLKRSLANLIYADNEQRLWRLFDQNGRPPDVWPSQTELRDLRYEESEDFATLTTAKKLGYVVQRQPGRYAHTMVGLHGLTHVERIAEEIFAFGISGDFVDAGVWRGGCGILMRAMHHAFGETHRQVWVADSFAGVPVATSEPDLRMNIDLSEKCYPWMSSSLQAVQDTFATYELLDSGVRFLPGLFSNTLPEAPIDKIALLRIDGDLYTSTLDCLEALYDRVSNGGFIIVDDYGAFSACREAVDVFRSARGITAPLVHVNWTIIHWRKDG